MKILPALLFVPIVLVGCNEKIYDVSYYSEHLDEAAKVMEKCKTGDVTDDNCKNAGEAIQMQKRKEVLSSMFKH